MIEPSIIERIEAHANLEHRDVKYLTKEQLAEAFYYLFSQGHPLTSKMFSVEPTKKQWFKRAFYLKSRRVYTGILLPDHYALMLRDGTVLECWGDYVERYRETQLEDYMVAALGRLLSNTREQRKNGADSVSEQ